MKVLVVGATGVLGQRVVRGLLEIGVSVRAMTRAPERASALRQHGAEVVPGDLIDRASLARACAGVDRVFAAAHGLLGRGRHRSEFVDDRGHRDLIDAARAAAVQRFVYTSAQGASANHPVDFFRAKFAVEQYLAASGMPYVILRPTAFMEWHVHNLNGKGVLDKGVAQLIGAGTKKRNFVAADDVAALAVRALLAGEIGERWIAIGGPGNYSNNDVAALYARLAGKPPRVRHLPAALAGWLSRLAAPLHPGVARILAIAAMPDEAFTETFDCSDFQRDHPDLPLTALETFVRARVAEIE